MADEPQNPQTPPATLDEFRDMRVLSVQGEIPMLQAKIRGGENSMSSGLCLLCDTWIADDAPVHISVENGNRPCHMDCWSENVRYLRAIIPRNNSRLNIRAASDRYREHIERQRSAAGRKTVKGA